MKNKIVTTLLILLFSVNCKASDYNLPDLGDSVQQHLSINKERELGVKIVEQLKNNINFIDDPLINDYVTAIGTRLLRAATPVNFDYQFFVINDNNINAFALPGGFIFINSGLLKHLNNESELAAVLAHEISHVTQRHIARMVEQSNNLTLSAIGAAIASVILAATYPDAAQGALLATVAGINQANINYTRHNEEDADNVGIKVLHNANFSPYAMAEVFNHLKQLSNYATNEIPEYLYTHPVNDSRIIDAINRANFFPYMQYSDSLDFYLTKARLKVLYNSEQNNARYYFSKLQEKRYDNETAANYAYVISLQNATSFNEAAPYLNKLLQAHPNNLYFNLAYLEQLSYQQDSTKAKSLLNKLLKIYPNNRSVVFKAARFYLNDKQYNLSEKILSDYINHNNFDQKAYYYLAKVKSSQGDNLLSHEYQANYKIANRDYYGAITQLKIAKKYSDKDELGKLRLEAKIKQIEELVKKKKS